MKQLQTKFIAINPRHCEACWQCVEACPRQVIGKIKFLMHRHVYIEQPDTCIGCKKCVKVCQHGAIQQRHSSRCEDWHVLPKDCRDWSKDLA